MSDSVEIIDWYRKRGLSTHEMQRALARHARLLRPLDPRMAHAIESARIRGEERHISQERRDALEVIMRKADGDRREAVRRMAQELRMSQEEIGKFLGIGQSQVSRILTGMTSSSKR